MTNPALILLNLNAMKFIVMARSIASNTAVMFIRTAITMGISLYTSRLVLLALGVTDFGIFSLVATIVSFFTFLNSSLSQGSQRFLNFELGRNNPRMAQEIFSTSFKIHIIIALMTLVIAETLGLWFLKAQANIPPDRMHAALVVYQLSVISTLILILQISYTAAITAMEKFAIFALFDIGFALLRLASAIMLVYVGSDKLILYGVLTLLTTFIMTFGKFLYCRFGIDFCRIDSKFNRALFSQISRFTGWGLFGTFSVVMSTQGAGIVLNVFFGPLLNAAQSVAVQVANASSTMGGNLQIVVAPQIVKAYSSGNMIEFQGLIEKSSRFAFFLMLILAVPIIVEADFIFTLWLDKPPDYSVEIAQILLVTTLLTSLSLPLTTAAQASGDIRNYQVVVGSTMISSIPISIALLSYGASPLSLFFVNFAAAVISLVLRIWILKSLVGLDAVSYVRNTIVPVAIVASMTAILATAVHAWIPNYSVWPAFGMFGALASALLSIWFLGVKDSEKNWLINSIWTKFVKVGRS